MASLHKHSSGRSPYWFASFQGPDGKFKLVSTKQTDRAKAMTVALEWERAAKQARAGLLTEAQARSVLSDILEKTTGDSIRQVSVEKFLNDWRADKEAAKGTRTAERYANTIRLFLEHLEDKANRPITSVTPRHIQNFLTARLRAGKSSKTVNVDIKTLNAAFNRARRQGIISTNPVEAVELPKVESHTRDVFTPAQVKMLVETAPSIDWKTLILLGFYTGARLRDCAAMTWENVELANGVIAHKQQKTGKQVIIPLHADLEAHLSSLASTDKPETHLCPSLAEKDSGGKTGLSATFKDIMRTAGIDTQTVPGMGHRPFSKLTFHSLRHSFNSALANAGVSQELRMKLTGHTTADVNAKYTHHELAPLKAAVAKLPSLSAA